MIKSVWFSQNTNEIALEEKSEELNTDLKEIFKAFMKSQTEFNKKIAEEIETRKQYIMIVIIIR